MILDSTCPVACLRDPCTDSDRFSNEESCRGYTSGWLVRAAVCSEDLRPVLWSSVTLGLVECVSIMSFRAVLHLPDRDSGMSYACLTTSSSRAQPNLLRLFMAVQKIRLTMDLPLLEFMFCRRKVSRASRAICVISCI